MAQSSGQPAVYKNTDGNGVDLTDGTFNIAIREGSMGSGVGAVELWRYGGSRPASDNVTVSFDRSMLNGVVSIGLTFGNRRETFSGSTSTTSFGSNQRTGATLTKLGASEYRHVADDGTVTTFGPPPGLTNAANNGFCSPGAEVACSLVASSTVRPNGVTTVYEWDVGENCTILRYDRNGEPVYQCAQFWRQRGLANNLGYAIRFAFQQEANPTSGLPGNAWHIRSGATLSNARISGALRTVTYSHPASGVVEVTDDGGRVWRITSNTSTGITAVRRPGSTADTTVVAYGSGGVTSVSQDGVSTSYSRVVNGATATTTVTDALSQVTVVTSNLTIGRPTSIRTPDNQTTTFAYDTSGRLLSVTAPEGNSRSYVYDARGNVTQVTDTGKPGAGAPTLVSSFGYPAACTNAVTCNKPDAAWDPRNNRTDFTYDPGHGDVTSVTRPAGPNGVRPQTRYGYAAVGSGITLLTSESECRTLATCIGTADERRTTIAYNHPNLLPTSISAGSGDGALAATTAMTYTAAGDVASVDGPMAGAADTTDYRYSAARELTAVVMPVVGSRRRSTVYHYLPGGVRDMVSVGTVDPDGVSNFQPVEVTTTSFDAALRKTRDALTAGGTTSSVIDYSYDAVGRPQCVAVRMNQAAFGATPGACSLGAQGADGPDRITRTGYDAAGRVIAVTGGFGTADASTDGTTYSANGQVQTVTDANGNATIYAYDGLDRLSRTTYPGGSYEELGYDAGGNVTQRRLRDGQVIGYTYDALDRLVAKDRPNAVYWETDTSYGYDLLGRLTQASDSNGRQLTFGYDALGRRVSQGDNWFGFGAATFRYDAAGRRTRLTWADGNYVGYEYDPTGAMTAIRENGGTVLASFAYDALGRRTSLTRANGTVTSYAYDAASRLQALTQDLAGTAHDVTASFTYNAAGQIASRTGSNDAYAWTGHYNVDRSYGVNGLNQLTNAGATTLGYDARGNLTSSGGTPYVYSADGEMTLGNGIGLPHDALGRLFYISSENGVVLSLSSDGDDVIAETDLTNGVPARRYVFGPGTDEPLVWYEGAGLGDRRFLHADERGSIVAVSGAGGTALAVNRYDEYGIPQAGNMGRFQYTGQKWLPSVGLYDYKARMYSPTLGRFMQPDPIGYADGLNRYDYVGGDPVNLTDPDGLQARNPPPSPKTLPDTEDKSSGGGDLVVDGYRLSAYSIGGNLAALANAGPGLGASIARQQDGTPQSEQDDIVVTGRRLPPVRISGALPGFGLVQFLPGISQQLRDPTKDGGDYCGSSGSQGVPDTSPSGAYIGGACETHDRCYATLGASKASCDVRLYNDIRRECVYNGGSAIECNSVAYIYYGGVFWGGGAAYNRAQKGR